MDWLLVLHLNAAMTSAAAITKVRSRDGKGRSFTDIAYADPTPCGEMRDRFGLVVGGRTSTIQTAPGVRLDFVACIHSPCSGRGANVVVTRGSGRGVPGRSATTRYSTAKRRSARLRTRTPPRPPLPRNVPLQDGNFETQTTALPQPPIEREPSAPANRPATTPPPWSAATSSPASRRPWTSDRHRAESRVRPILCSPTTSNGTCATLLFHDEELDLQRATRDPVLPAQASDTAKAKKNRRRTDDLHRCPPCSPSWRPNAGAPAVQTDPDGPPLERLTEPTPLQRRVPDVPRPTFPYRDLLLDTVRFSLARASGTGAYQKQPII